MMNTDMELLNPRIPAALACLTATLCAANPTTAPRVTFTRDVAPILQQHCQTCHRPGEAAPFSLLTYQQARPWAKAIKEAVLLKKMPPWFADPRYGKFSNDRSLPQSAIDTLAAWADAGAPPGDPRDLPPSPHSSKDGPSPSPMSSIDSRAPSTSPPAALSNIRKSSCLPDSPKISGCSSPKPAPTTAPTFTT